MEENDAYFSPYIWIPFAHLSASSCHASFLKWECEKIQKPNSLAMLISADSRGTEEVFSFGALCSDELCSNGCRLIPLSICLLGVDFKGGTEAAQ